MSINIAQVIYIGFNILDDESGEKYMIIDERGLHIISNIFCINIYINICQEFSQNYHGYGCCFFEK